MVKDHRLFLRVLLTVNIGLIKKKKAIAVYSEQLYGSIWFYRAQRESQLSLRDNIVHG